MFTGAIAHFEAERESTNQLVDTVLTALEKSTSAIQSRPPIERYIGGFKVSTHDGISFNKYCAEDLNEFKAKFGKIVDSSVRDAEATMARGPAYQQASVKSIQKKPSRFSSLFKFGWITKLKIKSQLAGITRAAKKGEDFTAPKPPVEMRAAVKAHMKGLLAKHLRVEFMNRDGVKQAFENYMARLS